jgi:hypothetical protein
MNHICYANKQAILLVAEPVLVAIAGYESKVQRCHVVLVDPVGDCATETGLFSPVPAPPALLFNGARICDRSCQGAECAILPPVQAAIDRGELVV